MQRSFGLALGLLLGCSHLGAQEAVSPPVNPSADTGEQPVAEEVVVDRLTSDGEIESRLTGILEATDWFPDVAVQVQNSVVFLDGVAVDADKKEWATSLARNTTGVAAVISRLEVQRKLDLADNLRIVRSSLWSLWGDFLAHSPFLLAAIVIVLLTAATGRIGQSLVTRLTSSSKLRASIRDLIVQFTTIAIWATGLLVAAVVMFPGMTPARALTVLGLGSVAIGFAFKDIFENFFAGVLILWKYPFDRGDFVECGDVKGRIEEITIRMTMIRQVDGQLVVVPNATLFKNPVDVLTDRSVRRTTLICGVAYDTQLGKAREVFEQAVAGCSTVRQDEPVEIYAQEFAASSINFEVTWWTGATPAQIRESRDEVVRSLKRALDDAGIEIPFPQRTLWLPNVEQSELLRTAAS